MEHCMIYHHETKSFYCLHRDVEAELAALGIYPDADISICSMAAWVFLENAIRKDNLPGKAGEVVLTFWPAHRSTMHSFTLNVFIRDNTWRVQQHPWFGESRLHRFSSGHFVDDKSLMAIYGIPLVDNA